MYIKRKTRTDDSQKKQMGNICNRILNSGLKKKLEKTLLGTTTTHLTIDLKTVIES